MKRPAYFPALDSMRFVACMCVFFAHSTVFFHSPGRGIAFGPLLINAGYYGVIFFYCLSGFLITYLLLHEKKWSGTIAVGRFYMRRALRIWPLYYLMTFLSFFLLGPLLSRGDMHGALPWTAALALYVLFLPNVATIQGFYLPTSFHLYTIGFEEQFYLVWPLLLRRIPKGLGLLLAVAFFLPMGLSGLHEYLHSHGLMTGGGGAALVRGALTFADLSNVPAFAAGGAGAYLYMQGGEKVLKEIGRRVWGYAAAVILVISMYYGKPWTPGYVNVLGILFVLLILNLVIRGAGKGRVGSLFSAGGKVSYGIYVYHPAILILVGASLPAFSVYPLVNYFVFLAVSLVLVFGVAALSYVGFERYFLRKKKRYQPAAT